MMTMRMTTTMTMMTPPSRRPRPTSRKPRLPSRRSRPSAKKAKAEAAKKTKADDRTSVDFSKLGETIEKEIEGKLAPTSKEMEELGETIEKEIEGKFGPDFEKKMEELGEKIGKDMEAKFGPGSDFEKKMKELGKEMEARFGPGSEFEKKMKELGKEMEAKFGPGSDFEKKIKEQAEKLSSAASEQSGQEGVRPRRWPHDPIRQGDGEGARCRQRSSARAPHCGAGGADSQTRRRWDRSLIRQRSDRLNGSARGSCSRASMRPFISLSCSREDDRLVGSARGSFSQRVDETVCLSVLFSRRR